jgi:hypothetical protein
MGIIRNGKGRINPNGKIVGHLGPQPGSLDPLQKAWFEWVENGNKDAMPLKSAIDSIHDGKNDIVKSHKRRFDLE